MVTKTGKEVGKDYQYQDHKSRPVIDACVNDSISRVSQRKVPHV